MNEDALEIILPVAVCEEIDGTMLDGERLAGLAVNRIVAEETGALKPN